LEQQFLGHVMAQAISSSISVEGGLRVGFAGHENNHEALLRGDLDLYADYTGTALRRYLKLAPLPREQVHPAVQAAARERWNVVWLEPFGFDNTYGLIMRAVDAARLGVRRISDLAANAGSLCLAGTAQFLNDDPSITFAPGGYTGVSTAYRFRFGHTHTVAPDYGESFDALTRSEVDVLADFVVNPRIVAHELIVLEDDRDFFAAYHAAPIVRGAFLSQYPEVQHILERLAWQIDNRTMAGLNYAIEFEGCDPAELAAAFLTSLK
jgi:glycine betaine/choline ABC-type transport system substrate-binding protein